MSQIKTYYNFSAVEKLVTDILFEQECKKWLENFFLTGEKFKSQNATIFGKSIFIYKLQDVDGVIAFQHICGKCEGEVRFDVKFSTKTIKFYGRALTRAPD